MPSVPESGNNAVVDSKSRPNSLKIPEATKYTDVKRTSSASFKPPMSKDPVLKKKTDVPHTDSSWFGPLSYIKSMFGGKPSAESASQLPNNDKVKKVPPMKNTSNVAKPKVQDFKETVEEQTPNTEENKMPTVLSEPSIPPPTVKDEHSPRFSFTSDQASGRRGRDKSVSKKTEPEEDDPNAPRYNALRFVENKSTYLHTPDKKGTTSFRITTSSKVKSKPNLASLSPVHGNNSSKRLRKSPVSNRKSSASPKKIPQSDSNTTANFPTRLRSKSTPDHSSVKPRPVSDTTCPKSLSLKPNSNKTVPPSLNDANENRAAVACVKPSSKLSIPTKPTFHGGGKPAQNLLNKKTSSRCSKSSLQIGFTPSPHLLKLTRSSSVGDNRDLNQGTQGSGQNKSDRGNITVSSVKSNSLRPTKPHVNVDVKNQENSSNTKRITLDRRSAATKVPPLAESPTFTKPSIVGKKTPINRTRGKESDPLAKFAKAQQRAKDKLKTKESATDQNKMKAHQMVLPATVKNSPCLNSRMGQVTNSKPSSPSSKIVFKRGKPDSAKDISPTIAESPVRRPSPPGVMCLTNNTVSDKKVKTVQDESKKAAVGDQELKQILSLPNSIVDPPRSSIIINVDSSPISPYAVFPTTTSNAPDNQETPDCDTPSSMANDLHSQRYVEPNDNIDKHDSTITAFYSDCSEQSVDEDIYHVSSEYHDVSEYHDMSNSACCNDEHNLEYHNNMDVTDYEIDHFSNDCEHSQDTCNSALSRKSVSNRRCLTSTVSEDFGNELTSGPSIISRKKGGELLPFQNDIGRESVDFFADESPATSTTVMKNIKRSPEPFPISSDGGKDRQKGGNESRRRFPFDIDTTKIASLETEQNDTVVGRTPVLRSTSPTSLRGRSGNRVHPSPYVRTTSPKDISGSSYLEAINRQVLPTVQEPSLYGETLKRRNRPDSSPNITFSAIASSVGEAIDSIRQKLPSVMKFAESPTKTKDSSPMRSELSPTKMLDKPLSATATYITTFLEDKGLSPLPWNKPGENDEAEKLQEVTTKSSKGVNSSLTSSKTADQKQKLSPLEYSDDQKTTAPEVITTSKKKSQIKVKKNLEVEPKQASPPPSKNVIDSTTESEISETAMVDRISKTIEQTKQLLSIVFSPPKNTSSQCKMIEKLEGDQALLKSETKASKKNKDLAKNETKELKTIKDVSVSVTTGKKDNRELKVSSKPYNSADPINWPTITKPGFPKIGKSPEMSKTDEEPPKVLPPTTKTSPVSITAHSLLQMLETPQTLKQNPSPKKTASAITEGTLTLAENGDKAHNNSTKRIGKDTKFLGNGPSNNISHFTESGEMP